MYWWHWIIAYTIIGAGIVLVIIPNKTILFDLLLIGIIALAIFIGGKLPFKDDLAEVDAINRRIRKERGEDLD